MDPRSPWPALAAAALLIPALAACGGSSDAPTAAASPSTSGPSSVSAPASAAAQADPDVRFAP